MRQLKYYILAILMLCMHSAFSQGVPIGSWRVHAPYGNALSIADAGERVYCATGGGLFFYDKTDNHIETLSRINGLSDAGITKIAYDPSSRMLLVLYSNTNIDLIENNRVINMPDIYSKQIQGVKTINDISIYQGKAYISMGFGIVVLDITRKEIKDTYFVGNPTTLPVHQVAINGTRIFAGTDSGVYSANLTDPFLSNPASWVIEDKGLPSTSCKVLSSFGNRVYANVGNSVYRLNTDSNWINIDSIISPIGLKNLRTSKDKLVKITDTTIVIYDSTETIVNQLSDKYVLSKLMDVSLDNSTITWVADLYSGLFKYTGAIGVNLSPNGPNSLNARRIKIRDNRVLVAPTILVGNFKPFYNRDGFFEYYNGVWKNYHEYNTLGMNGVFDIVSAEIDPKRNRFFLGSFRNGLIEFENGSVTNIYDEKNSTIMGAVADTSSKRVGGLVFDSDNNLWMTNFGVPKPVSVFKSNGSWESFGFPGVFTSSFSQLNDMIIDSYGNKWVILMGSTFSGDGLLVFNEKIQAGNTFAYRKLAINKGLDSQFPNQVNALVEDLEGKIWLATAKGIVVYYNPGSILSDDDPLGQQIKIVQDGLVQYLLEQEFLTCIAVDGANRKWIGSQNGVWLFSADGTKQIAYFNTSNSPLISNNIINIAVDGKTGEVFFATDKGIISYKSTATEGGEVNENVKVYPNPVTPDFDGLIAINGLVANANVKITDLDGRLVYQTIANGGQAVWNGKNFEGIRVSTGIYLVFATNADGLETAVQKILFVN